MSKEQWTALLSFLAAALTLVAKNPVASLPVANILLLAASIVELAIAVFFGAKVAAASKFVQGLLFKLRLKRA